MSSPEASASGPGFVARVGMAIGHPRWALTGAADRRTAGRSGSDLILLMLALLAATQLRGIFASAWLGSRVEAVLGARALMQVLTRALTIDLGVLLLGALILYALAGPKRNLGRAFDLACVAALPLVFVDLAATTLVRALELFTDFAPPPPLGWGLSCVAYGWTGALIALALPPARIAPARVPPAPPEAVRSGRRAGLGVLAVTALGVALQVAWISSNIDILRPMTTGDEAPAFALRSIGPKGVLGAPVPLAQSRGKVTVLDFWATWCQPCLASMPRLDALAKKHPEVAVLAIDLDDPVRARALFDERGYSMVLLMDDGSASDRYGVTTIPHTVLLDASGVVRRVFRGSGEDLEAAIADLRK